MAETTHETQNVVGIIEYSDSGTSVEITIPSSGIDDELINIIKKVKLEYFAFDRTTNMLVIIDGNETIIDLLLGELEKGKYNEARKNVKESKCNQNWLDASDRASIYKAWLDNNKGAQKGLLRGYVEQAQNVNKYLLNHLDNKGNRIAGTKNNVFKILALFNEKQQKSKPNNRPTYREIVKNSANLKHDRVYSVKNVDEIIDNILAIYWVIEHITTKISVPKNEKSLKGFTFEEPNLAKNNNVTVKNI